MKARLKSGTAKGFGSDERGSIAIVFAACLIPAVLTVGLAVDVGRAYMAKTELERALDSTALAVSADTRSDREDLIEAGRSFFAANHNQGILANSASAEIDVGEDGEVVVKGSAEVNTLFMGVAGFETIDLSAEARSVRRTDGIELAMAMDASGSMKSGGRMEALREAGGEALRALYGDRRHDERIRVSLVPYSASVNIGSGNERWVGPPKGSSDRFPEMDHAISNVVLYLEDGGSYRKVKIEGFDAAPEEERDLDNEGVDSFLADEYPALDFHAATVKAGPNAQKGYGPGEGELFTVAPGLTESDLPVKDKADDEWSWGEALAGREPSGGAPWKGCVEARAHPNDVSDVGVSEGGEWPRYFWESEPDNQWPPIQEEHWRSNADSRGPNVGCPQPVEPLTSDRELLDERVEDLVGWRRGGTFGNVGLAWAWRTLSPEPPFSQGADYDDENWNKAAVIMTDGRNQWFRDDYSAYGRLSEGRLGTTRNGEANERIDARMLETCRKMKARGIELFTVTFMTDDPETIATYRECASSDSHWFDAGSDNDLARAFRSIGARLSNVRLTK